MEVATNCSASVSMKTACIVLTLVISVAIMAICVMVKFATDVTVDERSREFHLGGGVYRLTKTMGVIALSDNTSSLLAERFLVHKLYFF